MVVVGGSVVVVVGGSVVVVVGGSVVGDGTVVVGGGGWVVGDGCVVDGGRVVVVVGAEGFEKGPNSGRIGSPGTVVVVSEEDVVESRGTVVTVVVEARDARRVMVVLERSICAPSTSGAARSEPPRPASATIATAQVASTHQNHRPSRTRCTSRRYRAPAVAATSPLASGRRGR